MSKRKRQVRMSEIESDDDSSHEESSQIILIPDPNYSGDNDSGSDDENYNDFPCTSYKKVYQGYSANLTKLEAEHEYNWVDGEKNCKDQIENETLLSDSQKKMIVQSTPVQLFESFFSDEIKNYISAATKENNFELSRSDLDIFIGILIFSCFNKRKSQRDVWSTDPFLSANVVSSVMSRNRFESIKAHIKYSKASDNNPNDKGWRVRSLINLFQKNILQFGYFQTAMSIDEMMIKSYAKTSLKQFIRGKPIRFGLKMWGLCTSNGYLLGWDLYRGKNQIETNVLMKCALGSRVVMNLLKDFLHNITPRKINLYHVYFDNYFTNFDLILHLRNIGLRATGTIRNDRVKIKNEICKKAERGTFAVKNDKNSQINYITVMDSKPVSIASTAAGVNPTLPIKRYSSKEHEKKEIQFPHAFHIYNKYMGGVDTHDAHCNNLLPSIRNKKWTWVVFTRLIQASITNSVVIYNTASTGNKKSTKQFALDIAKHYLANREKEITQTHVSKRVEKQSKCSSCPIKTYKFCKGCNAYVCKTCFPNKH
ncbi:piggyBac transposable element-derived protein 3-like [Prorops nasuta]|uniref:piggyBac transposable element-derived protein 3-like n=1 Tax=Prorops nasuta TaxID=863751 RepID=UPI0034CF336F